MRFIFYLNGITPNGLHNIVQSYFCHIERSQDATWVLDSARTDELGYFINSTGITCFVRGVELSQSLL
ncbi:hypothetical protein MCETHM1_00130 [Flavobacteriaceae bacterium]